jgi:hypothetical protein
MFSSLMISWPSGLTCSFHSLPAPPRSGVSAAPEFGAGPQPSPGTTEREVSARPAHAPPRCRSQTPWCLEHSGRRTEVTQACTYP